MSKHTPPPRLWHDATTPFDYEPELSVIQGARSLTELANIFGSDKGNFGNGHGYASVYENLIPRGAAINLLEIGVACGASLKMWSTWLPNSRIFGIDIRQECLDLCKGYQRISIEVGSLSTCFISVPFDVVIDDASHISEDIVSNFEILSPRLRPGGLYIIEDLACTYSEGYTSEYNKTFKSTKKNDRSVLISLLDRILRDVDQKRSIKSVIYYPELLVLKLM